MNRKLFSILIIFFFFSSLQAQNKKADSLEKVIKTDGIADTLKSQAYCDLCWEYIFTDMEKALNIGKSELAFASKINYKKGMGQAHHDLGSVYVAWTKYSESKEEFEQALKIRKEIGDQRKISATLVNLSAVEGYLGNYSKCLNLSFENLKIFEELNEKQAVASILGNIGMIYYSIGNRTKALEFCQKSFDLAKQNKNIREMAVNASNIGNIYFDDKDFNLAEKYFVFALENFNSLQDTSKISLILESLGTTYIQTKNYKDALTYLTKALKISERTGNSKTEASTLISLGVLYGKLKNYQLAESYYLAGISLCKKNGIKITLRNGLNNLAEIYELKGEYKKALQYYNELSVIKDSLVNEESVKQIAEMQTKYETEKKEKENIELKAKNEVQRITIKSENDKRKNQVALSLAFTGLLGIGSIFIYNRKKLKQKAELAQELANQEKLRFKAIIEAEEKERARIAQELHDGLGQMLSTARLNVAGLEDSVVKEDKLYLDRSLKIIDDACVEVRNISHNMMPNALIRLGLIAAIQELVNNVNASKLLKIDFSSNVHESLGKSLDITIYRIVQEVLNNMIKHSKADRINLEITQTNNKLLISMKDNGIGFNTDELKESKGMGWKNIFSRVSMLNGTIELNSKPQQGTIVYINLMLQNG